MQGARRETGAPFAIHAVRRATSRRVMGATTNTVGKATAQEMAQFGIQTNGIWAEIPMARAVESPETMKDISPDRMNPNRIGAKRAGIMGELRQENIAPPLRPRFPARNRRFAP